MEVFYANNFDGCAGYSAFCDNGFDAGPLLYEEDAAAPGFYRMRQNPLWKEEKPQIILFSDFLNWYEPIDYKKTLDWLFYTKEIGIGKKLGFPQGLTSYRVAETQIKTTYLTRMDETTFCHDVIVIASLLAHYGSRIIPVTEWYRFRTIRSVQNDLMGELEISIYKPSDNMKGWSLLNCLAPDFGFGHAGLEDGAAQLLRCYYDKALCYPCRVDARELADNMGYAVREEALSDDRRIRSRVVFDEMDITVYDPDTCSRKRKTIGEKTILVDPAANHGDSYNFTEDSILHECNHVFWHQGFQKMQTVHRERMALAGLDCDLETILLENSEQEELKLIERQARALTPRVRMPAAQVTAVAQRYQQENMRHYGNSGRAVEKTIGQTALFFGSSKTATKNRLRETGSRDVEGILVHCNGHYLPRHSWSRPLQYGETYSVESSQLNALRKREPVLNALLAYEVAVYVDGFVCMNDPQYVTSGKWGRQLTTRALNDLSRCCLLFRIQREREDNEYTYGVLNSIDKRGMEHVSFDVSSVSSILEEAEIARGIRKNLPDEFLETLEGYIRALNLSKNQLAAVTTMDEDRLKNIRRNKVKNVSFDEVILLGLGLGLQPEKLDDLMEKSTAKYDRSERCSIIRVLYRKLYEYPVTTFNEALIACNQDPLSNAS